MRFNQGIDELIGWDLSIIIGRYAWTGDRLPRWTLLKEDRFSELFVNQILGYTHCYSVEGLVA